MAARVSLWTLILSWDKLPHSSWDEQVHTEGLAQNPAELQALQFLLDTEVF